MLVHCSDSWNRTAQVCSVASLLLQMHYLTLKGLMVLMKRTGFTLAVSLITDMLDGDPKEISPVVDQLVH